VEDDIMLRGKLDTYMGTRIMESKDQRSLEIARNFLALGIAPEKVAQAAELPLRKVKALLKSTAKMKLTA
jgi:hypothetical protein